MALFKKKAPTAEEIVELIEQMSDDEKDKLAGILTEDLSDGDIEGESDDKEGETTEQIEEAERDIAEKGEDSQSEKDRIDESVGEDKAEEKGIDKDAIAKMLGEILPDMVKAIIKEHEAEEAERDSGDDVDDKTKGELARIASIYNN